MRCWELDAAMPADSLEDLQLSLNIFVDFCNEMHLYVATAKTSLVVFHNDDDDEGVVYNNGHVYVDGQMAKLMIFGDQIKATDSFKYLGMMLHSSRTFDCHADSRISAFTRATKFVLIGLSKIPSFSHAFLKSLWRSLIEPVGLYGMELCERSELACRELHKAAVKSQRKLLRVGGRAPADAVECLLGFPALDMLRRTRRIAFFTKWSTHQLRHGNTFPCYTTSGTSHCGLQRH